MKNKTYTIIMTSNRKGGTRSFTISATAIKLVSAILVFSSLVIAAAGVDYFGLLIESGENKRLRTENAQLEKQFQVVESKLSTLESGLERIKTLTKKIQLITNIEDEDRELKLSIGPRPQVDEALQEYEQAMQHGDHQGEGGMGNVRQDAIFTQQAPLDEVRGELATAPLNSKASLSIRIDKAVAEASLREQGVIKLQELLVERQSILNATPNIKPTRGWFTSRFGYRVDPFSGRTVMHYGTDIASAPGTPVLAPADGIVSYVGYESGYGKILAIDHGYGVRTRYAHNSQIYVQLGQKIKRRDVISAVGSTGKSSGPHLHYEVRINDVPVDPINYILNE